MVNKQKLYVKALNNPQGLRFNELVTLAEAFGFSLTRTRGSHRVLKRPGLFDYLNVQPDRNGMAKAYQVQQLLDLVEAHDLSLEEQS